MLDIFTNNVSLYWYVCVNVYAGDACVDTKRRIAVGGHDVTCHDLVRLYPDECDDERVGGAAGLCCASCSTAGAQVNVPLHTPSLVSIEVYVAVMWCGLVFYTCFSITLWHECGRE